MCSKKPLFSGTHCFIKDYMTKGFQRANLLHGFSFHTKVLEMATEKVMERSPSHDLSSCSTRSY